MDGGVQVERARARAREHAEKRKTGHIVIVKRDAFLDEDGLHNTHDDHVPTESVGT